MTDYFRPQSNGRRAIALTVAMMVAADGRYTTKEAQHVSVRSIGAINDWGKRCEEKYALKTEPEMTTSEFLLVLDACARRVELTSGPDDDFVGRVLAVVSERAARLVAM
ncbi:MAG: hypothetical protein AAF438_22630, partial [Pseudomonadota bacterium]